MEHDGDRDCRGPRPGGGCDYVEQATCAPAGPAVWLGHYAAFKCSAVYRHWSTPSLFDAPTQSATVFLADSRVGLGSGCVSTVSLPTTCPGHALAPPLTAIRLLVARLGHAPPYYRCTDKPNTNGVYQCVYTFRGKQTTLAAIVLKPLAVSLRPSPLTYAAAVCKVFGTASTACKYAPTFP